MKIKVDGPTIYFEEMPVGEVFFGQRGEDFHLCLKAMRLVAGQPTIYLAVILAPRPQEFEHYPTIIASSFFERTPIVHIEKVEFALSAAEGSIARRGAEIKFGDVICHRSGVRQLIVAGQNNRQIAVDLRTGQISEMANSREAIVYTAWSINLKNDGATEPLASFSN